MSSASAAILYGLTALGAVGVYLALPGGRRSARTAGLLFGLAAIAGFVVLSATQMQVGAGATVTFCLLAAAALFGAARVITHPKPVYSAVYFILVVVAVACLMVLLQAEFLGVALIIVYAGAILVTYVFVIMLAQQSGASAVDLRAREPVAAVLVGFVLVAAIAGQSATLPAPAGGGTAPTTLAGSNTAQVGLALFTQYIVALEIAGILLLVALIGALALARKRVPRDVPLPEPPPPGQIGREVTPF